MATLTKKALSVSMKELMSKNTLDKITVTELVEHCGVNRQTFYYHFQDLFDLLEWIIETDTKQIINDNLTIENWKENTIQLFKYYLKNKDFYTNVVKSPGIEPLQRYLFEQQKLRIASRIKKRDIEHKFNPQEIDFLCVFIGYAIMGTMIEWIKNGMKEDYLFLVNSLDGLIERKLLEQ